MIRIPHALVSAALFVSLACAADSNKSLVAVIHPTKGNQAEGTVRFQESKGKIKVSAEIKGLKPGSKHGFHIHQYGDCSAKDATSAGGHYNPQGHDHAGPETDKRHAGDFGNLLADSTGRATYSLVVDNISLDKGENPIVGRGVIVHAGVDDLKSQPTGNAGARIGCGVIGYENQGE